MPDPDGPDDPGRRVGALRCLACGRTTDCIRADLDRVRQAGWPTCCGQPMSLFTTLPPAGDTRG